MIPIVCPYCKVSIGGTAQQQTCPRCSTQHHADCWKIHGKCSVFGCAFAPSTERIKLEQIKIASPCPASWKDMIGDEQVRFCSLCSKNVYNLSSMSKVELETLVNQMGGKLCARIFLRKDGSVMTTDCAVGLAAIRRRILTRLAPVAALILSLLAGATMLIKSHKINVPGLDRKVEQHEQEQMGQL